MRVAVFSDIHSNAYALEAVQKHARQLAVDTYWFLGDALGYGPHPVEALEFWQSLPLGCWVPGNHDARQVNALSEKTVNDQARESLDLNREALQRRPDLMEWLVAAFPDPLDWVRRQIVEDSIFVLVHGGLYREPRLNGTDLTKHHLLFYMYPWLSPSLFMRELEMVSLLRGHTFGYACMFSGHTHIPQFWFLDGIENGESQAIRRPIIYDEPYQLTTRPTLVNPGSVGQPRDGDKRASYAVLDTEIGTITFYRVDYPIERTKRDMMHQGYPAILRERLSRAYCPDDWPAVWQV